MTLTLPRSSAPGVTPADALPDFVVRVAGLPVRHVQRLRFERTERLLEEWLALELELGDAATAISDALYERIGTIPDPGQRGPLIALRRAIFNLQAPKQLGRAAPYLESALLERIAQYDLRRQRLIWIQTQGQGVLDAEWAALREHLRDSAGHAEFQRGLLLSSQDLHSEVLSWLRQPTTQTSRRKLELSVVQYILRAATKTSPFSTLTSLARGRWGRGEPCATWTRHGYAELSRSVANQLMQAFAQWPEVRAGLRVRLNSSLQRTENGWQFLAWRKGERLSTLRFHEGVAALLEAAARPDTTYRGLLERVADNTETRDALAAVLDRLIGLGVLELRYATPERAPEHLQGFLRQVAPVASRHADLWANLQAIGDGLERFGSAPRRAKAQLDDALTDLCAEPRLRDHGLSMPTRNTLFEDTLIPDLGYSLEPRAWAEVRADLNRLAHVYAVCDPAWQLRRQALEVFKQHAVPGQSLELMRLYEHCRNLFNALEAHAQHPLLERVQQEITERGTLSRAWADEFIRALPASLLTPRSLAFYAQPLSGGPGLVINAWQGGDGRARARLRRFERKCGLPVPSMHGPSTRASRIPVDLGGVFGTNVNLRDPETAFEIPYPGYHSDRPDAQQLHLNGLRVRLESHGEGLQLFTPGLELPLEPIHTGLLGETWLPGVFRFLMQVFGSSPIDPTRPYLRPTPSGGDLRFLPRLTLGSLVIERARWVVPRADLPVAKAGEPMLHTLKHLARWRAGHGIPDQVFLQSLGGDSSKPTYTDFRNPFGVDLLGRQLDADTHTLVFHEVLPALGDEGVADRDDRFVHEIVLESRLERSP
jgi:Lantibiotic dehydratase, N terminus